MTKSYSLIKSQLLGGRVSHAISPELQHKLLRNINFRIQSSIIKFEE